MISLTVLAAAEEKPPALEVAVRELSAAYAKHDGFIAVYQSKGEGKSLEYTVGLDEMSGLAAAHMIAKKGEQKMEARFWNTDDDRLYYSMGGELFITRGIDEELKSLSNLSQVLTNRLKNDGRVEYQLTPYLLLTKDQVGPACYFRPRDASFWTSHVKDAPISATDEKTVTFVTKDDGSLTLSRENGMLIRQSITGTHGEDRVLELKEFRRNPGRQAIEAISKDWSGLGAKGINALPMLAPIRLTFFQGVIDAVEAGDADLGKLETLMEDQNGSLRNFADACISEAGDSPAVVKWREMPLPDKDQARKIWLKEVPGASADDEEAFKSFLTQPEVRAVIRKGLVETFLKVEGGAEKTMAEFFGENGWKQLKTQGETGEAAKDMLCKALASSYFGVMIDHRMNQAWGRPDGLD